MCLLCVEIAKGKITVKEVDRALGELRMEEDHIDEFYEVYNELIKEEQNENNS